jgi:two-component system, cell cycle sensor histidine kinase and response regulator CckA
VAGVIGLVFLILAVGWIVFPYLLGTGYLPHQYCYGGDKGLVWGNALADAAIGLSYLSISAVLLWIAKRAGKILPYAKLFWLFGLFIVSCGAAHGLEVVTLWKPVYWLSTTAKIVTAATSICTGAFLLYFARDILKLAVEKADLAELRGNEQFRAVVQAAPMAVIAADCEGLVTSWNRSAEKIFGFEQNEILGTWGKTVPEDLKSELRGLMERSKRGEIIRGYETVRLNREGECFPVSISMAPQYDESMKLVGIVATTEDIRERKRVEQELKKKSATLSAVTDALNTFLETGDWSAASKHLLSFALKHTKSEIGFLGVVVEGPALRVLAHDGAVWSQSLNKEFYESKMQEQQECGYFEHEHHKNLLSKMIYEAKTVIANEPVVSDRRKASPAGHPELKTLLGVPIFKGTEIVGLIAVANRKSGYAEEELRSLEEVARATGVLYDNYRQNLKQTQLEDERTRLESEFRQSQKMEVLGRLAGGVAHDFNNMLMVLMGSAELLQRSLADNLPAKKYLDQIRRTADKAAEITKQLLAFSHKQLLDVKPVDVHEVLTESEFLLPRLLGSDVELTFHHEAACSWIKGDPVQLEQVIANLAINARDAMPLGGKLTISTRNTKHLPADSSKNGASGLSTDWLLLEVRDSGCGMDEVTKAHIFEPFYTTKGVGKGTGLGLSTVYGIVHQFGGSIRVDTRLGVGTSFQLFFPALATPSLSAEIVRESGASENEGKYTILLADDESAIREAIAEYLRSAGHEVLDSHSALEALEIARHHKARIDIMLTDVVMPGLRGTELAQQVAEMHRGIHVIYMSGYAPGVLDSPLPAEAGFLQKPFRFASLNEQLKLVPRKV